MKMYFKITTTLYFAVRLKETNFEEAFSKNIAYTIYNQRREHSSLELLLMQA